MTVSPAAMNGWFSSQTTIFGTTTCLEMYCSIIMNHYVVRVI